MMGVIAPPRALVLRCQRVASATMMGKPEWRTGAVTHHQRPLERRTSAPAKVAYAFDRVNSTSCSCSNQLATQKSDMCGVVSVFDWIVVKPKYLPLVRLS
jgi:hypothetical protein